MSVISVPRHVRIRSARLTDSVAICDLCSSLGEQNQSPVALEKFWQGIDVATQTIVMQANDNSVVAYAQLRQSRPDLLVPSVWVHQEHQRRGLGTFLLRMLNEKARVFVRDLERQRRLSEHSIRLHAQAWSNDQAICRLLERGEYTPASEFLAMELRLVESPICSPLPAGITIRPFVPEQDDLAVYQADEEAFLDERDHRHRSMERWRVRFGRDLPYFDPALWLLACRGSEVIGCILNQMHSNVGEIMHLGVRKLWRKHGIGNALLQRGLLAFYQRQIRIVQLNVDAHSLTNAQRLYKRAGFVETGRYINYTRPIS